MISPGSKLSLNRQLRVLGISKGRYYHKPAARRKDEAAICAEIDREHTEHPFKGVGQMTSHLSSKGHRVNRKRVRRLMRRMGIHPVYPKENTSKRGQAQYVHKYLLRGLEIKRRNQVWSTDITYVAMPRGHAYLYAIIDVHTRYIVAWGLYTTLEASNAVEVFERAVARCGKPEIINSDQGCQYTSHEWVTAMKEKGVQISMDGRGRCRDNAWIERFWRTLKWEYVYMNPHETVVSMRNGIAGYIEYYNNRRPHSSIGNVTPKESYLGYPATAA